MIDDKEYAKQMRENAVIDNNGNVIVSEELWQQIANIIETQQAEIEKARAEAIKEFADRILNYIDVGHLRPPTEICFSDLDVRQIVEKIAKEMVGAENESKCE